MATVIATEIIEASVEAVWISWNDFGGIEKFHPGIKSSRLINDSAPGGVGADRQCDMSSNGKMYVRERMVSAIENEEMVVEIYEATVPIKTATATVSLEKIRDDCTKVRMQMDFTPGLGPIGWLMTPLMKSQFRSMVEKMLAGNNAFVTQGTVIGRD